jgi:hypothetical protein
MPSMQDIMDQTSEQIGRGDSSLRLCIIIRISERHFLWQETARNHHIDRKKFFGYAYLMID